MTVNREIINIESKKEMREKHGESERWKNYAQRAQKNPFVRSYLMDKYGGICQYCGLPINKNLQLQHRTYDKECVTGNTIKVRHSTPKVPNGTREVPDCEHCSQFHECVDGALFPVHGGCNWRINQEVRLMKKA